MAQNVDWAPDQTDTEHLAAGIRTLCRVVESLTLAVDEIVESTPISHFTVLRVKRLTKVVRVALEEAYKSVKGPVTANDHDTEEPILRQAQPGSERRTYTDVLLRDLYGSAEAGRNADL